VSQSVVGSGLNFFGLQISEPGKVGSLNDQLVVGRVGPGRARLPIVTTLLLNKPLPVSIQYIASCTP